MNAISVATRRPAIVRNVARQDLLQLYRNGQPDYKRIADFAKLSKADLGKISGVSRASVRFDASIPDKVAERLREVANIANLVAEFFEGNAEKVGLWFELQNPVLGNISPRQLIRIGRYKRLLNFVMDSRDAESAAPTR